MMGIAFRTAAILLAIGMTLACPVARAEEKPFTMQVTDKTVSITAKDASALEVLRDLGEKAGIEVRVFEGVEDRKISMTLTAQPLEEMPRLLQKMNLNYVYGHEGEATHMIVYVLPEGKVEGDRKQGEPLGPPPEIESVWSMDFDDVVTGVGSLDGQVVLLDKMPDVYPDSARRKGRLELIVHDKNGEKLWSRLIDALGDISATPSWDRISIETEDYTGIKKRDDGTWESEPSINVEIFDRSGKSLGKSRQYYGLSFVSRDSFVWLIAQEGGGGKYSVRDFSGNTLKEFGGEFWGKSTIPDDKGYVLKSNKNVVVLNSIGEIIFESPRTWGTIFDTAVGDEYLVTGEMQKIGGEGYIHLYHIPTSRELISFFDSSIYFDFAHSVEKDRAAILTSNGHLYIYDLNPLQFLGKYDLSPNFGDMYTGYNPGTEGTKGEISDYLRFDGERIYMLGREKVENKGIGTARLRSPLNIACWNIKGTLLWKIRIRETVTRGAFTSADPFEITVWGEKEIERLIIRGVGR